jgi:prepilin-type N-terminal cleavage/methylation domain-containing protein
MKYFRTPLPTAGFTLLEILVVTSIIAILSSILYVSFSDSRNLARDRAMMSEFKQVQLALQTYYAQNDAYPAPNPSCGLSTRATESATCGDYIIISNEFITELPRSADSGNSNCQISYQVDSVSDPQNYKLTGINCIASDLVITLENDMARCPSTSDGLGECSSSHADFAKSFAVYSPGGQSY